MKLRKSGLQSEDIKAFIMKRFSISIGQNRYGLKYKEYSKILKLLAVYDECRKLHELFINWKNFCLLYFVYSFLFTSAKYTF